MPCRVWLGLRSSPACAMGKKSEPIDRLFALFVILYRLHEKREPAERPTASDVRALRDILEVQCGGKYAWAERLIRAMFENAAVRGPSVAKRWASLLAFQESHGTSEYRARRGA